MTNTILNCVLRLKQEHRAGAEIGFGTGSVSDPYSLNPDPVKNLKPDPDPERP